MTIQKNPASKRASTLLDISFHLIRENHQESQIQIYSSRREASLKKSNSIQQKKSGFIYKFKPPVCTNHMKLWPGVDANISLGTEDSSPPCHEQVLFYLFELTLYHSLIFFSIPHWCASRAIFHCGFSCFESSPWNDQNPPSLFLTVFRIQDFIELLTTVSTPCFQFF